MATPEERRAGDKHGSPYLTRQPTRWIRNSVLLATVLVIAALAWTWQSLGEQALVGTAYGARVGCVCRYVSKRPLASCEGGVKVAGIGRMASFVSLAEDAEKQTVTASVPLLARQSAAFHQDTGCQLGPWED